MNSIHQAQDIALRLGLLSGARTRDASGGNVFAEDLEHRRVEAPGPEAFGSEPLGNGDSDTELALAEWPDSNPHWGIPTR